MVECFTGCYVPSHKFLGRTDGRNPVFLEKPGFYYAGKLMDGCLPVVAISRGKGLKGDGAIRMNVAPEGLRVRFSLRMVFLAVVAVAVGCALLFSTPNYIAVPALFFVVVALPAVLTAGVIFGRRGTRAFCIGALFPTGLVLYATGWLLGLSLIESPIQLEDASAWMEFVEEVDFSLRLYAAGSWCMALLIGALVAFIGYWTTSPDQEQ